MILDMIPLYERIKQINFVLALGSEVCGFELRINYLCSNIYLGFFYFIFFEVDQITHIFERDFSFYFRL